MATIKTAFKIQDAMTPALHSINNVLNIVLDNFENLQNMTDKSVNISNIKEAREELKNISTNITRIEENAKKANYIIEEMPQIFNNASNSVNNLAQNSNSVLKTLMGFSLIQKMIGLVSNQLGSAIDRMDTMNNYPKVMSNLGIGAKQSNASIKILSENLKGLPTTLNDAVSSVQNFTSVNNNILKSTKMFLALNNAILAGGGSTQVQQSALEQLSQAYAKGKPDMMEWRTAMTAMPAQLKQVAQAMGYVNANKLGEALRAGKVSMNDFMDTFIQLNEKGANGFQSFEEQARNATGGFATSIANMKSAVTRGITNLIEEINTGLTNAGFGTIQVNIQNIGSLIERVLSKIGNVIGNIIRLLSPAIQLIQKVATTIGKNWSIIRPVVVGIVTALGLYNAALKLHAGLVGISTLGEWLHHIATVAQAKALLAKFDANLLVASSEYALAVATAQATVAQTGFNTALMASPITWILIIIIAIIAAIYVVIAVINKVKGTAISATGVICGGINVVLQFFKNLGLSIANIALAIGYAIGACANNMGIAFHNVICNIQSWFYGLLETVVNVVKGVADALNKIPFVNIDTSGLVNKANEYARNKAQAEGNKEEYKDIGEEFQKGLSTFETWQDGWVSDAYNGGYNFGQGIDDTLSNMFGNNNKFEDLLNNDDLLNGMDNSDTLTDISGNTKDIASSVGDISDEDLKYLLDIAERDTINRFTTVPLTINLTNNNNINGEDDIDGIVDKVTNKMAEKLEEELEYVADGVHV